jgi:hypothetical protein
LQTIWTICSLATPDPFSATTQPEQEIDIHQRTSQMDGVRTRNAYPRPTANLDGWLCSNQCLAGITSSTGHHSGSHIDKKGMLIHDTRLYMACQFSLMCENRQWRTSSIPFKMVTPGWGRKSVVRIGPDSQARV